MGENCLRIVLQNHSNEYQPNIDAKYGCMDKTRARRNDAGHGEFIIMGGILAMPVRSVALTGKASQAMTTPLGRGF